MKKEEIEKNLDNYLKSWKEIVACSKQAITQITEIVKLHGGNINVSGIVNEMCVEGFSVVYNGGNHPEYSSNVYSEVERIYIRENQLFVETEDADMEICELLPTEVMGLLEWIWVYHKDGIIEEYEKEN